MPKYTRWGGLVVKKVQYFVYVDIEQHPNVKLYDNGLNEKFEFVLQIASSELILPKINTPL